MGVEVGLGERRREEPGGDLEMGVKVARLEEADDAVKDVNRVVDALDRPDVAERAAEERVQAEREAHLGAEEVRRDLIRLRQRHLQARLDLRVQHVPERPRVGDDLREALHPAEEVLELPRPVEILEDRPRRMQTKLVPRSGELLVGRPHARRLEVRQARVQKPEMRPLLQNHILVALPHPLERVPSADVR
jgi:hypothetical protein